MVRERCERAVIELSVSRSDAGTMVTTGSQLDCSEQP